MSESRRLGEYNYITQVQKDTRFRLAEYVVEQTGLEIEQIDIKDTDTIPDYSDWLYWQGNKTNILSSLSVELDIPEDTIRRRLSDYEKDNQFELHRIDNADIEGAVTPVNLRLLKPGIGYYAETITEMRIRERLLSEESVERLERLVGECAMMAAQLGDQDTSVAFAGRYEYKSPFEFNRDEYRKEIQYVRQAYQKLKSKTKKSITSDVEHV